MATGFIYIVTTLTEEYVQEAFCNVPTQWGDRLYYGPCKEFMRPKIRPGDYIFGISCADVGPPRRVVFVGHVEERMMFKEAYFRFPDLNGPKGPIHVRPVNRPDMKFPLCSYEHIPGSMHSEKKKGKEKWRWDLASRDMDAFFVCFPHQNCVGHWLGKFGPEVDDEILQFLKTCSVHGEGGKRSSTNKDATRDNPIVHIGPKGGRLYTGLHLETDKPEVLVELCKARITASREELDTVPVPSRHGGQGNSCGSRKKSKKCR